MLTSGAESLIDHDEKPRELDVLSHGRCDLWDNHQGCLEQEVIMRTLTPSRTEPTSSAPGKAGAVTSCPEVRPVVGWGGVGGACGAWPPLFRDGNTEPESARPFLT